MVCRLKPGDSLRMMGWMREKERVVVVAVGHAHSKTSVLQTVSRMSPV
jgi:hypothetical protein